MNKEVKRHYLKIILAGYRIYFFKDILTIKKCKSVHKKNIDESIRFLLDNKRLFKNFINNYIEIYRRRSTTKTDTFIHDILKEFRNEREYLNIITIDVYNENDIELTCIKKQFIFKRHNRKEDLQINKKLKEERENIHKYFPNIEIYDGKEF